MTTTSMLPALLGLLAAATEPPAPDHPVRTGTIEITIAGPEGLRRRMEQTLRALVGDAPDVRWATRERMPGDEPFATKPEGGTRIWIDVANPAGLLVYLPSCSADGTTNVRTVERSTGQETDLLERETVAQIVKAAVLGLRGDSLPGQPTCGTGKESREPPPAIAETTRRRRKPAFWLGMGSGAGWGYVPEGKLEWEQRLMVVSQTGMTGMLHLLPEVGYMWSDDFAIAAQVRVELIRQEKATYRDPYTGEVLVLQNVPITGEPKTTAIAGFLRAIWLHDLSARGILRLSLSGDLGGGVIRFPVDPVAVVVYDPTTDTMRPDWTRTIAKTDTRPMGMFLFGGSVGLLWQLSRSLAVAVDGRILSGLPSWGVVMEGQVSARVGFGSTEGG